MTTISAKQSLFDAVGNMGAYQIARMITGRSPRILFYHRFNERDCNVVSFEAQIRHLRQEFNVISLSALHRLLQDGDEIQPRTVVLTIDDGYADFGKIAFPILRKYSMPATIYIVSDFVDRKIWLWPDIIEYVFDNTQYHSYTLLLGSAHQQLSLASPDERSQAWNTVADHCLTLRNKAKLEFIRELARDLRVTVPEEPSQEYGALSWRELREMQDFGVEVGSHTCTHPKLTMLDTDDLEYEIRGSKIRIEQMLDRPVEGFCYPNGTRLDLNDDVTQVVRCGGYKHATVGFNDQHLTADMYALRRYSVNSSMYHFRRAVYGVENLYNRWMGNRINESRC